MADIGEMARIDFGREKRCGQPEVVFGEGKTPEQVVSIMQAMIAGGSNVLCTRASETVFRHVEKHIAGVTYNPLGRTLRVMHHDVALTESYIAIVAAGTADAPVVEEAFETATFLGNRTRKIMDVGVAGIHRLFDRLEEIRSARVVIAVAGMEGALASVVAGLVSSPVIAVPTSVGYGASLGGIAALLTMLNSCATLSVVNIDNGYGAASQASRINRL